MLTIRTVPPNITGIYENNTLQATSLKTLGIKLNIKLIFSTALLKYSSVYNTVGPKPEQIGTKPNPNIEGIKKKWVLIARMR